MKYAMACLMASALTILWSGVFMMFGMGVPAVASAIAALALLTASVVVTIINVLRP